MRTPNKQQPKKIPPPNFSGDLRSPMKLVVGGVNALRTATPKVGGSKLQASLADPLPRPSHPTSIGNTQSNPSFFSTMTQGAALGLGSSVGHRMVDGLFFEPQENKKIWSESQSDSTTKSGASEACKGLCPDTPKNKEPTITFDDPYLCNKKMEQYVKCTHEQSNHSICDKLYDNYLQCVSSHLERE